MAPATWDEGIATGIESLDAEHRLQVSLVDALEQLVRQGTDPGLAGRTLAQLIEFTRVHFASEELMMRLHAYPQLEVHRAEHERLTGQVEAIRAQLEGGPPASALDTIGTLHQWLTRHIRSMDQAFAAWCAAHGLVVR